MYKIGINVMKRILAMNPKYCVIDFEFNRTKERYLHLVCCSLTTTDKIWDVDYWLHDDVELTSLEEDLMAIKAQGYTFIAHGVSAEASSFYSLGFKPQEFKWIDTFIEYRMISNHCHKFQYGRNLINGKIKPTHPPKSKWEGGQKRASDQLDHSLAQLVYRFLRKEIDTEHKTEMRNIIINGDYDEIEDNKDAIMKYCRSDIKYLYPCYLEMLKQYDKLLKKDYNEEEFIKEMLWRGETSARTAIMERTGYPIDVEKTGNFSAQVPNILSDIQSDINEQFPDIHCFHRDLTTLKYVKKEKVIFDWIKTTRYADEWPKTPKGKYTLKLEAFTKFYNFQHSYPRDNFGAQMVRFLKTKQNLNGFLPAKKGKKTFWDSVGKDGRSRAWLNQYGAQSARYQPGATGFLFLKSAWMRALCVPPKGRMIVGIDYKSQEFLLSAIISGDEKMYEAYLTGDVYLHFGKEAKIIPQNGTKKSHTIERAKCKSTVLGLSYGMTKFGLSKKLTEDSGVLVDEDEAQVLVDEFDAAYPVFCKWKKDLLVKYGLSRQYGKERVSGQGKIKLPDGWYMFGDNGNSRSITNVPIQGFASCILRKAIALTQDNGLDVVAPLHDAGYIECDLNDWEAVAMFSDCMKRAFTFYFKREKKEWADSVGLDIETWSPELTIDHKQLQSISIKCETMHIDERALDEYNNFSKYFDSPDYQLL